MENINSGEVSDSSMVSTKLKASSQGHESNTMDSQDGGLMKTERNVSEFPSNFDGAHMNSDITGFPQGHPSQSMNNGGYNTMSDSVNGPHMSGYGGYNRPNYGNMNEQHGGLANAGNNDYPNNQFSQFSQQGMRPGYPQPHRPGPMSNRMPSNNAPMMPPNYHPHQQRFPMSGQSIQQQGGPTPTLNQLLQNAGSNPESQRFQDNYSDYPMEQQNPVGEMSSSPVYSGNDTWGGPQRQMSPYPQAQMSGNQPFRNQQTGQAYGSSHGRTPGGMSQNFSQSNQGQQFSGPTFNPGGQRFPPRPGPMGMSSPSYGSQQMNQHGPTGQMGFNQQSQLSPNPQQSFMHSQPTSQDLPNSTEDSNSSNDVPANSSGGGNRSTPTPTSSGLPGHPSVTSLRPIPSPVGSTGSRSNTPHSLTGPQSGSPMPPFSL